MFNKKKHLGLNSGFNAPFSLRSGTAPQFTANPVITGTLEVGEILTCSNGTVTGTEPITYSYQWKRGTTNIGLDQNTYTTVVADEGENITCEVTATNAFGSDVGISNVVNVVLDPAFLTPTIWLNARTEDYTLVSGRISTWTATNGSNATQGTAANRPIPIADGTANVIDFDASTRWMTLNSTLSEVVNSNNNTGGFEVWSIIKLDAGRTGTPVYFGARTATKLYFQLFHGGGGRLRWFLGDTVGADARALTTNAVFPIGQTEWALVRLVHNETTNQMEIWVNGIQMTLDVTDAGNTAALDFTNYNPAYNVYLNGVNKTNVQASATSGMLFGDFMAFNRLLTTDEANALTNYYI